MDNKNRLVDLVKSLIRIDSQNPPGREREIAVFVKDIFSKYPVKTRLIEFKPDRTNVIVFIKGHNSRASLLLTPHLDTVPIGRNWDFAPLGGKIHRGRIYGRGATDCKANIAVCIETLRKILEKGIRFNYDIIFAATADEETGSYYGLIPLLKKKVICPDFALILDADDFNIIIAQKGLLHIKIGIIGKSAHGAYPDRGINAIDYASEFISQIKKIKFAYKKHRYLKPPTINIGTIRGGDKVNMVADWCQVECDIRYLPGMDSNVIIRTIKKMLGAIAKKYNFEIFATQAPYEAGLETNLVKSLRRASLETNGFCHFKGSEGATVMTFFQEYNIPCVATGFGSENNAHSTNESVSIGNLKKGEEFLTNFLFNFNQEIHN